jgi:hypothetical protein
MAALVRYSLLMHPESQDPELQGKEGVSTSVGHTLPSEKPKRFIHIPDEVIREVARYMVPIIGNATQNREVEVKAIIENAKNMFRDGVRYHDTLWMHHCAASMREIISFIDPEHYIQTFQSIPSPSDPRVEKAFLFLISANSYLSSIVHFRPAARISDAEQLYPGQGYGQKTLEDFLKEEPQFFEELCIDLVYTLHVIFQNYCAGPRTPA